MRGICFSDKNRHVYESLVLVSDCEQSACLVRDECVCNHSMYYYYAKSNIFNLQSCR